MIATIYDRWGTDATLNSLVPAARVYQGYSFSDQSTYPYVSIQDAGNAADQYTTSAVFENHLVRFEVYDSSLDNINANILPAIRSRYNRKTFTNHRGETINLQWQNDSLMYNADGTFRVFSNYLGIVQATAAT